VPPTSSSPNTDYIVIARTTKFDYIKTAASSDPLYSQYKQANINANQVKKVSLHQLATFNGKLLSAKSTEYFGSYLDLVEPESVEWTEDQEYYPFVMVTEGTWDVTTSVEPPDGFVADQPAIETVAADTTTAVQFTLTDIGSDWTETVVNHTIKHLGETKTQRSTIGMVNKRRTKARTDNVKMMMTDGSATIFALANDRLGFNATAFSLTSFTQPVNGTVTAGTDGISLVYMPAAGFEGDDAFAYTITDDTGFASTGTVNVRVLPTPAVRATNTAVPEGNAGVSAAVVTFVLSNQSTVPVTVDFETVDGNAKAGLDYAAKSGTVTFNPGDTRADVAFAVLGDVKAERNETFTVKLSNPVNAGLAELPDGEVRILDEERPVALGADQTVNEGDVTRTILATVEIPDAFEDVPVTINYATADGTASAGTDYLAASGTLTFAPGVLSQTIPITLVGDTVGEATEQFFVNLSSAIEGLIEKPRMTITLSNDDLSTASFATAADFLGGVAGAGAAVLQTEDGEVTLAPQLGAEFFGAALPAGWTSQLLAGTGSVAVGDGVVRADGASLIGGLTTIGTGRGLDFVATFTGKNQAVGFGAGAVSSPLAVFIVKNDLQLYARTVAPNTNGVVKTQETLIAGVEWKSTPHTYTVDWNGSRAVYRVDGVALVAHSNAQAGSLAVGPMIYDGNAGAGALSVDWIRLTPFALAGTYTLRVDSGDAATAWGRLTSTLQTPAGTGAAIRYRIGNTASPDATWSAPVAIVGGGDPVNGTGRYIEITVEMTSADGARTPTLKDLAVTYRLP
jgi:hypothetical protein